MQANGPGRFQLASKVGWDAFVKNTAARQPLAQLTRAEMAALTEEELEDDTEARLASSPLSTHACLAPLTRCAPFVGLP